MYLIDVGSSTIKVYRQVGKTAALIITKSIDFCSGFSPDSGLSSLSKHQMFSFFCGLISQLNLDRTNTKIFATGIFRDISNRREFVWEFYVHTHLFFNIISHDLEAFYLEKIWEKPSACGSSFLVINIGGKTTELIGYQNGKIAERRLLSIGVGIIRENYPSIDEQYSGVSLDEVKKFVIDRLPREHSQYNVAIYTGRELTYMRLAGYHLTPNTVFSDGKHPSSVSLEDYIENNQHVFYDKSLADLQGLMPEDPKWMNGARACSAIAQAIFSCYEVKTIIPSDSDLIDGAVIQDARNVVVCGSFNKHLKNIAQLIQRLQSQNITILSPRSTEVSGSENDFVLFTHDNMINHCTWSIEALHMHALEQCDLVIVCNFDNYIGSATATEIGYALSYAKRIVFVENNSVAQNFDIPSEITLLHMDE